MRARLPLALGALLGLAACGGGNQEVLRIGGMFSTTGPLAGRGFAQLSAARLATAQINAAGGVLGKHLVLVYRDDGTDANKALRAARALQGESVPVIVGAVSSDMTTLAAAAVPEAVFISPSATAVSQDPPGLPVFRLCESGDAEGRLLAQRARAIGSRAAILRRPDDAAQGLAAAFREAFERDGREVVQELSYAPGQESYTELIDQLFQSGPQVVLLVADPVDGAQIVRDAAGALLAPKAFWFFTQSLDDEGFVTAAGPHTFGFSHAGTGPSTPLGRRYTFFADAFQARYGEAPPMGSYAANAYDAVYLAVLAIEAAGQANATAIRDQLRPLSLGGTAYGPDEFEDAVKALHAGQDVNYEGASGSVDLDATGRAHAPFDVWEVQDGVITVIDRAVSPPM
jgi:ABC-type branched-subunit amino acid transport system substrate-binding protein